MIISLNWLKKFVSIDVPVADLATLVGSRLVEIEKVVDLGAKYSGALVVKVIDAKKMDGSDHLSICKIDDGGVVKGLDRDEDGYVQVVCGAPNIKSGQSVVWLPPKSIVPNTYETSEQFILDSRNLRGVMSNGMIASARELDLFDEHTGILVVDDNIKPGTTFAVAYELDDYLLDIENKSLTHRPDCFGIIGFAREIAAITGRKDFHSPDFILNQSPYFGEGTNKISVKIDDPNLSDRYQTIVMTDGDFTKQSPLLIQTYLARVGVRPISAVVDVTNYLMMLTGQPLHSFDLDKMSVVAGNTYEYDIHVRPGKSGEKLELLDGKTIELTVDDIVIAAGDAVVALAGAMGGANTAVDENTRAIIIESASFNLYKLRSTQMRHGIYSEAITRFTKGQPAALTAPTLGEAVRLMTEWTGARPVSTVAEDYPGKSEIKSIDISLPKINEVLGTDLSILQAVDPIGRSEFKVDLGDNFNMSVTPPYWRSDIHIPEDIIEEIGRINGFDNIEPTLPTVKCSAVQPSGFDKFRNKLRKVLTRAGANESLLYSFVHSDIITKSGQSTENSYRIVNSISPELQYYRQSLTPGLVNSVFANIKQGYDDFAIYEVNKVHKKSDGMTDEKVPVESESVALVISSKSAMPGAPYYRAKRQLDYLLESFGLLAEYQKISDDKSAVVSIFEPKRSALIIDKKSGSIIGVVGEYKKSAVRAFKLPEYSAGFEIDTMAMYEMTKSVGSCYRPISRFQGTERDICFKVGLDVEFGDIIKSAELAIAKSQFETSISPVDIYSKDGSKTKNITIRVKLTASDHTITADEVTFVVNLIVSKVKAEVSADVV